MNFVIGALTALVVARLMEPWARLLHGKLWHRALLSVHRSHHEKRRGRFERNDILSATHAPVAAALVMIGCNLHGAVAAICIGVGAGMTTFGVAYVLVHDGFVHGRLPLRFLSRAAYFRRVREAHSVHHARGKEPFGFFRGPEELTRAPHARAARPSAPPRADRAPS